MKNTDAVGKDEFCLKIFKNCVTKIAKILTHLINCIMETKIWPKKLKIQVVRPIFKKGRKQVMDNYRPVSILPTMNKIIEKFFALNLQNFLKKENIIIEEQFGFQKGKGTNEALKILNSKVAGALHEGKSVGAIFVDLQKAFDTINRTVLIQKMRNTGIPENFCCIMESYLQDRFCCVKINNKYSNEWETKYGVPQGSILGPILFLIYINDIKESNNKLNFILFADDIVCLAIEQDKEKLIQKLQEDLNYLQDWCTDNDLYINEEKTKIMLFKNNEETVVNFKLHSSGCFDKSQQCKCGKVDVIKSIKYLGVTIDDKFNFELHVDEIIKKLRQVSPKLYQLKNILNGKNKKIVYESLIKPHLLYAVEVYGNGKKSAIKRLEKVQNKLVKILFTNKVNTKAHEIYVNFNILKIQKLHAYVLLLKNFFKFKNKREEQIETKSYNTKNFAFKPILTKNKYGEKLENYVIPRLFNKLPEEFWNVKSFGELKKASRIWLGGDKWD
jgi:hypothetical protein